MPYGLLGAAGPTARLTGMAAPAKNNSLLLIAASQLCERG